MTRRLETFKRGWKTRQSGETAIIALCFLVMFLLLGMGPGPYGFLIMIAMVWPVVWLAGLYYAGMEMEEEDQDVSG